MPMNSRLLRPRASGFNPKSITGLKIWLDATDASTIVEADGAGTGVSEWKDKSGNAFNFSQTTANNRPEYTGTLNGKPVITFNGSSDSLTRTGVVNTTMADSTGAACFVVFRPVSDTTFSVWNNSVAIGHRDQFGGLLYASTFRGSRFEGVGSSGAMPTNAAMVYVHAVDTSANTHVMRISGTQVHSGTPNFSGGANWNANTNSATYQIGNGPNNDYMNGVVAEILQYGNALTSLQISSIERYLGRKWGITLT